jgi:tripeptide aminopeptidase
MEDNRQEVANQVLDLAIRIQQIPAPTFYESQRSAFLQTAFIQQGLLDVTRDGIDNVFGRLAGAGTQPPVVVSAHLDTVFPEGTDLRLTQTEAKISGPGIGDNSLGVAGLVGVLNLLRQSGPLKGDVWFIANTREEGLGNLKGMRTVVERFGSETSAYIVLEGIGLGRVTHRGLGVTRYRVTMNTQGGHSWANFGRPSAVHELARFASRLEDLSLPTEPRTTYNIGVFTGGTSVNVIASEAHLELDLRSEDVNALTNLCTQVKDLAESFSQSGNDSVNVILDIIGQRPAGEIPADHPLVQGAVHSLRELGLTPQLGIGSTDANVPLSLGFPAICLGLTTGMDAHSSSESIHTEPIRLGLQHVVDVIRSAFTNAA